MSVSVMKSSSSNGNCGHHFELPLNQTRLRLDLIVSEYGHILYLFNEQRVTCCHTAQHGFLTQLNTTHYLHLHSIKFLIHTAYFSFCFLCLCFSLIMHIPKINKHKPRSLPRLCLSLQNVYNITKNIEFDSDARG